MIRGIYKDGLIYPADPIPSDWPNGQPVTIEPGVNGTDPSDDPADIARWDQEMRRIGGLQLDEDERERFQAVLDEADALAKEQVRREMESGR